MKIVTKGNLKWSKQVVCKLCNAVLEVEQDDIQYKVTDADAVLQQYQLEIEGTYFVNCPECGYGIVIKTKDMTATMRDSIRYKQ